MLTKSSPTTFENQSELVAVSPSSLGLTSAPGYLLLHEVVTIWSPSLIDQRREPTLPYLLPRCLSQSQGPVFEARRSWVSKELCVAVLDGRQETICGICPFDLVLARQPSSVSACFGHRWLFVLLRRKGTCIGPFESHGKCDHSLRGSEAR